MEDKAYLIVRRERNASYSARKFRILVDGAEEAQLDNGGLVKIAVRPGPHNISVGIGEKVYGLESVECEENESINLVCRAKGSGAAIEKTNAEVICDVSAGGNAKKKMGCLPKILIGLALFFIIPSFFSDGDVSTPAVEDTGGSGVYAEKYAIEPGGVFEIGGYIVVDDVEITCTEDGFDIYNHGDKIVRISAKIVGVKSNGDYEFFQMPAFYGIDKKQYEQDLAENGWAVPKTTNMVRPGETLNAQMFIFDIKGDTVRPDADGNGYYDVVFRVMVQEDEETISVSTDDVESGVYKINIK